MKYYVVLLLLCAGLGAQARDKLEVRPVRMLQNEDGSFKIQYVKVACGSEFVGVLITERSPKEAKIGVLVRSTGKACMGLPGSETITLGQVDLSQYTQVSSVSGGVISRDLKMVTPSGIFARKVRRSVLSFYDECRPFFGTVISEMHDGVRVGVLLRKQDNANNCGLKKVALPPVVKGTSWGPLYIQAPELTEKYQLQLAPVKPGSLVTKANKTVSFQYKRRCNDAPVGVLVRNEKHKQKVRVGMLVARYYNKPCSPQSKRFFLTKYSFKPRGKSPGPFQAMKPMSLLDPQLSQTVAVSRLASSQKISIEYFENCKKRVGTVISEPYKKSIAVGILTSAQKKCTTLGQKRKLASRWLANTLPDAHLVPMRIKE